MQEENKWAVLRQPPVISQDPFQITQRTRCQDKFLVAAAQQSTQCRTEQRVNQGMEGRPDRRLSQPQQLVDEIGLLKRKAKGVRVRAVVLGCEQGCLIAL